MVTVLFVCVQNAGRSQMAAALFNHLTKGGAVALSAGTQPAAQVHPEVATVMREAGLDLSGAQPQLLTEEIIAGAERVIAMGCSVEESCPAVWLTGKRLEDWELEDPAGKPLRAVRRIQEEIRRRVEALVNELAPEPVSPAQRREPS